MSHCAGIISKLRRGQCRNAVAIVFNIHSKYLQGAVRSVERIFYRASNGRRSRIPDSFPQIFLLSSTRSVGRRRRFTLLAFNLRDRAEQAFGGGAGGGHCKHQFHRSLIRSGRNFSVHSLYPKGLVESMAENDPSHRVLDTKQVSEETSVEVVRSYCLE